jgi:hypothetical protein
MHKAESKPRRSLSWQSALLALAVVAAAATGGYILLWSDRDGETEIEAAVPAVPLRLENIPFPGAQAYEDLKQLCAIGRRPSGSPGMQAQQKLLEEHFRKLGAQIEWQRFSMPDPRDGQPVPLANLIVHWHPQSEKRILLCTHYDTLPYPLRDPVDTHGVFLGANDGTSGTAVLMELGRAIPQMKCKYGVDFALLDAEEYMFHEQGEFFVGAKYFAQRYRQTPPSYRYRWGVLLDMVGDADLQIYEELNSLRWRDTRPLVMDIWNTARRLGVREFIPRPKHEISDDHLPLHDVAGIPTCDIIDFDYPYWHTQGDTPEHCSALSLAKVGWVLAQWLKTVK